MYISSAHRTGKWSPNKARPIIAVIPKSEDRNTVFKSCFRLKDTKHSVQNQIPASQKERRQFAYPHFKNLKNNKANQAVLKQGTLFVKQKAQTQYMETVLERPLDVDEDVKENINRSEMEEEGGSVFQGFSAQVGSLEDVAKVRDALITFNPTVSAASDIILAYRIQPPNQRLRENFDSDKDPGTGLELLKHMREKQVVNTVFISTRTCPVGYEHISKRRFEIINELCLQAYNK